MKFQKRPQGWLLLSIRLSDVNCCGRLRGDQQEGVRKDKGELKSGFSSRGTTKEQKLHVGNRNIHIAINAFYPIWTLG